MRHPRPRRLLLLRLLLLLALLGALAACGGRVDDPGPTPGRLGGGATAGSAADVTTAYPVSGPLTVFAAASLTEAFTELAARFRDGNPGVRVTFNFASSSALVQQINEGAPADVFASADEANMTKLTDAGGDGATPRVFALNRLQIIVPPGNPQRIGGLADLGRNDVLFVTCAPEVPIGRYAAEALGKAGVTATPVSYEENVKAVVTKVTSGEADAGIVYATDVSAAGSAAAGVAIPADHNVVASYPIVTTREAPNAAAASAFVDFVSSDAGTATLEKYGFARP